MLVGAERLTAIQPIRPLSVVCQESRHHEHQNTISAEACKSQPPRTPPSCSPARSTRLGAGWEAMFNPDKIASLDAATAGLDHDHLRV